MYRAQLPRLVTARPDAPCAREGAGLDSTPRYARADPTDRCARLRRRRTVGGESSQVLDHGSAGDCRALGLERHVARRCRARGACGLGAGPCCGDCAAEGAQLQFAPLPAASTGCRRVLRGPQYERRVNLGVDSRPGTLWIPHCSPLDPTLLPLDPTRLPSDPFRTPWRCRSISPATGCAASGFRMASRWAPTR